MGLNNNITAEIVSGLNEGDLVIAPRASSAAARSTTGGGNGAARRLGGGPVLFGGPGG